MSDKSAGDGWEKRAKGSGAIWRHPACEHAVVDPKGFGRRGVTWAGRSFPSVEAAKRAAMAEAESDA